MQQDSLHTWDIQLFSVLGFFFLYPVAEQQVLFRNVLCLLGELHRQLYLSALILV